MENVVNLNFWSLLSAIDSSVQNQDLEACLDYLEMLELIDDRQNLDEMGIVQEYKIVMLIERAGEKGLQVWKKVVSANCWKLNYHCFLKVLIPEDKYVLLSLDSIYVNGKWKKFKYSFDPKKDIERICSML